MRLAIGMQGCCDSIQGGCDTAQILRIGYSLANQIPNTLVAIINKKLYYEFYASNHCSHRKLAGHDIGNNGSCESRSDTPS
jgi:hypothetical protein